MSSADHRRRRRLKTPVTLAAGVLTVLLALVGGSGDAAAQSTPPPFEPGGLTCLDDFNVSGECDGDPTPGANSDVRSRFCVGWGEDCAAKDFSTRDASFGDVVLFTPTEFAVPRGETVPVGALAGRVASQVTLGLLNNPCSNVVTAAYNLMNASVDTDDLIQGEGPLSQDPLAPLALDVSPANGIPDGADHFPAMLAEKLDARPRARLFGATSLLGMWVTVDVLYFDPGTALPGPDGPLVPDPSLGYPSIIVESNPRFFGGQSAFSDVCSPIITTAVTFGLTRDNPCTPVVPAGRANCPGQELLLGVGYPLLPCESGNTVDEDGDGAINDGCPRRGALAETGAECANAINDDPFDDAEVNDGCPQVGDESEGGIIADPDGCDGDAHEASCVQRRNPAAEGPYEFTTFAASRRDADGDGIENELDVCPFVANPEWEARDFDALDESDGDGLPDVCDPHPDVFSPSTPQSCPRGFTGADEDQDCLSNRQDNCPLVNQLRDPTSPPSEVNPPEATDSDGDGIGDACDVTSGGDPLFGNSANGPLVPDGAFAATCLRMRVEVGDGASTAPAAPEFVEGPECASAPTLSPAPGEEPSAPAPTPTALAEAVQLPRAGAAAPHEDGGSPTDAVVAGALAGLAFASGGATVALAWRTRARRP